MPVYDFICKKCDHVFSLILRISDYEKKKFSCPKCQSKEVKREITTFQTITSKKS